MTSRDFAFWLQGFFEVQEPKEITPKQTEMIKRHLALVFKHEIDPSYSDDPKVQEEMNEIHGGTALPSPDHSPTPSPGGFNGFGNDGIHGKDDDGGLMRC